MRKFQVNEQAIMLEKNELQKAIKALQALQSILTAHKLTLSKALAEDASNDCVLIHNSLKRIAAKSLADHPVVLRTPLQQEAERQIDSVIRSIMPLRDHLRLCFNLEGLIDYQKAEAVPGAGSIILERNTWKPRTEAGMELWQAHCEIADQYEELFKCIKPDQRTSFIEALQHDWENGGVYITPFSYDNCVEA